jgi:hypothetical protein
VRVKKSCAPARAALAVVLASALLLTGCGAKDDGEKKPQARPSVQLPTGHVKVPESVDLTEAGTTLDFGQAATVAYEPNVRKSSVLSMVVQSVQTGTMGDFAAYQLDPRTKASTPYYVHVKVGNVGQGDLSRAAVPLLAVDQRDTLIQPSSFNNRFDKCPSTPLPPKFTAGKSARLCLVYLVPDHGKLTEMSFRPLQAFEPIVWRGDIQPAHGKKGKKNQKKSSNKDHKKGSGKS